MFRIRPELLETPESIPFALQLLMIWVCPIPNVSLISFRYTIIRFQSFSASPNTGCIPMNVSFFDLSSSQGRYHYETHLGIGRKLRNSLQVRVIHPQLLALIQFLTTTP